MKINPKTKAYLESLKTLTLDERTKVRMRDALSSYADLHEMQKPVRAGQAVRSPYFPRLGTGVLAFALVLLVGGSGAAYAAEGSVPGSLLYRVKVAVIEPVQGALITSAAGQAAWHAELASRRLEEATTLAVAGKLDTATQTYLQAKFTTEVQASNQDTEILAASGDIHTAAAVRSGLEARIATHAEALDTIATHLEATAASSSPSLESTRALLASIQGQHQEEVATRLALQHEDHAAATLARADTAATSKVAAISAEDTRPAFMSALKATTTASTTASTTATTTKAEGFRAKLIEFLRK